MLLAMQPKDFGSQKPFGCMKPPGDEDRKLMMME
jgi:hypothetical protein